jgi:hypothetical protein
MMVTAYHNRKSLNQTEEFVNKTCVNFEQFTRGQMQKAEEIPNLSQEEFDATWGRLPCRS